MAIIGIRVFQYELTESAGFLVIALATVSIIGLILLYSESHSAKSVHTPRNTA